MPPSRPQKRSFDDTNSSIDTQQPSSRAVRASRYDFATTYSKGRTLPMISLSSKSLAPSTRNAGCENSGAGPRNVTGQNWHPQELTRGQSQSSTPVSTTQLRPRNPYTKENRPTWRWLQNFPMLNKNAMPTAATVQNFDFAWPVNELYPKNCFPSSIALKSQSFKRSVTPPMNPKSYTSSNTLSTPYSVAAGIHDHPALNWNDFDKSYMQFNLETDVNFWKQPESVPASNFYATAPTGYINNAGTPAAPGAPKFDGNVLNTLLIQNNIVTKPPQTTVDSAAPSPKGASPGITSNANTVNSNDPAISRNQTTPLIPPVAIEAPRSFGERLEISSEPIQYTLHDRYGPSYNPVIKSRLEPAGLWERNTFAKPWPTIQATGPRPASAPQVQGQSTESVEEVAVPAVDDDPDVFPDLPDLPNAPLTREGANYGDEFGRWDQFNNLDFSLE